MDGWNLRTEIDELLGNVEGTVGIAVTDLHTGEEFHRNGNQLFPLASVFKVPVLLELYRQVEEGTLQLDRRYPVRPELKSPGSGVIKEFRPGAELTLWDLALLMIIVSDNTATDHVMNIVGIDNINPTLRRLGLEKISVVMDCFQLLCDFGGFDPELPRHEVLEQAREAFRAGELNQETEVFEESLDNNVSTPLEMNRLLEKVVAPGGIRDDEGLVIVSPEGQAGMVDIMLRQQLNQRIPYRLPRGTAVAHKTGTLSAPWATVCNDCGIVYADPEAEEPAYVISLLTKDMASLVDTQDALSRLSLAVYEAVLG